MQIKPTLLLATLLLATLLSLTACQRADKKPALQLAGASAALAQPAPLGAYLWALVELNGTEPAASQDPMGPHLIFLEDEQRIAGSTGCNRLMGGYAMTSDGGFTLGNVATTMMACPNMQDEAALLSVLREYDKAVIGASRIRLLNDEGEVIALFEARALPEA